MNIWKFLRIPRHSLSFCSKHRRRGNRRKKSFPIPAEVDVLEDRTLLAAPTVIAPIDDIVVYQDQVQRIATGLDSPLFVTSPPGDLDRLFIVEQTGQIRIRDRNTGTLLATPFLDLPNGNLTTGGERGLLGLAFHPDYARNGFFYVNFTDANGNSIVARYQVSADPNAANLDSALTVLTLAQPFANHNGGWMDFGPDGFLYLAFGDGGSANDPDNRAQNIDDLLGKILRIDVNGDDFPSDPNRNYAIPPSNPFVGTAGADEIWAAGLRNPWRPSFDRLTGDFFIADVGQNTREEVNFQNANSTGGQNYGWRLREGTIATPGVGGPPPPGAVDPVYDYSHGIAQFRGESVTGGYVYRGPIESLQGQYIFGDFISEQIWSIRVDRDTGTMVAGSLVDLTQRFDPDVGTIDLISSFAEDETGNLYVVDLGGEVFQVVPRLTDTYVIDLAQVFSDPEGNDTYVVESNSDSDSVGTEVTGTTLKLSFNKATPFEVQLTVRANDPGGSSITDTFLVRFGIPPIIAVGTDQGGGPHVRILNAESQVERMSFFAYDPRFPGGVRVAVADVNNDGAADVITAPGPGGGPHVKVFDGLTGAQLPGPIGNFFAFDPNFLGGVQIAAADLNGDGRAEIIAGADAGGGPHVRVFNGADGRLMFNFFAFAPGFTGGVRVAAGDVNGDGTPDIITGAGPGAGPHVRIFDGITGQQLPEPLGSFYAYDSTFTGGVYVSAALLSGDNRAEVITGSGSGGGPHVKIFAGTNGAVLSSFFAFESQFAGGVRVGSSQTADVVGVIVGAGPNHTPQVRMFDGEQLVQGVPLVTAETANFLAYDPRYRGGIFLAGGTILPTTLAAQLEPEFVSL